MAGWIAPMLERRMLIRRAVWLSGLMALLIGAATLHAPARAQEPNQAGLVIQFGDGRVETLCVALESEEITGADLLDTSGLDVIADASRGMGITVCQIEGKGCAYPSEACFCQCMGGGECAYWNYFYRDPGGSEWTYSALGAVLRKVRSGSVEAWVWGDGHTPPDDNLTFEAICKPPTVVPTRTPAPAQPALVTATAGQDQSRPAVQPPTSSPTVATAVSPSPIATHSPAPDTEASPSLASYWPFALTILGLAAIGVVVWLRRA
jgi:hypothetical protein